MSDISYVIDGGVPLVGDIKLSGSKNIALKVIIASLLFEDEVILENIPKINDVLVLIELINYLGASAAFIDKNTLKISSKSLNKNEVDLFFGSKTRVSFILFAPLLHKFNHAKIPNPGGCRIGARPIDRVLEGLNALGVSAFYDHNTGYNDAKISELRDSTYTFPKPSVTGTELLIMFAAIGKSRKTILENCVLEPEVDNLINFLNTSGADVIRNGHQIIINSVPTLSRKNPFTIQIDRIEASTFAVATLVTKGHTRLWPYEIPYVDPFFQALEKTGAKIQKEGKYLKIEYDGPLKSVDVTTGPFPDFPTDSQPLWTILMTAAHGTSILHEKMFEGRFAYTEELKKLGAKIEFVDFPLKNPSDWYQFNYDSSKAYRQTISVTGPTILHNGVLKAADLRAGASVVVAALSAKGESVINQAENIDRGYEDIVSKLTLVGAKLKKVEIN